jgi:hypothetical protein
MRDLLYGTTSASLAKGVQKEGLLTGDTFQNSRPSAASKMLLEILPCEIGLEPSGLGDPGGSDSQVFALVGKLAFLAPGCARGEGCLSRF